MTDVKEKVGVLTDEISTAGRPIYKTPEGEMVSEKSTTFKYKGSWINIPTIHNGYSYEEEELRIMLDNNIIKPTSTHKNLKAAEKAAKERSPTLREFNKGGTAMRDQMEMNFALGGRAETRDPVSGNDVPPGSLPVEVRDDIPARLSEGEYVVPADVVRYYGVKFFEDLRTQAKMGLQQMDADGRIGGEPIASAPSDMISDEELAQLEGMLSQQGMAAGGLAQGGMIDKLVNAVRTNPVVNERMKAAGIPIEMAVGGSVGVGIPANSQNVDPRKVDEVIAKIGAAAQQNPELMRMLGERGINVPRTTAMQTPEQMQQANSPAATTNPIMNKNALEVNQGGLSGYQEGGSAAYISQNPVPDFNPDRYRTVGATYFEPETFGPNLGTAPVAPVAPAGPAPVEPAGGCGRGMMWNGQMCVVDPDYQYKDGGEGPEEPPTTTATEDKAWFEQDEDFFTNPIDYIEKQLGRGEYKKESGLAMAFMPGLGLASALANKADDLNGIAKARAAYDINVALGNIDPKETKNLKSRLDSLGNQLFASGTQYKNSFAKDYGFNNFENAISSSTEFSDRYKSRSPKGNIHTRDSGDIYGVGSISGLTNKELLLRKQEQRQRYKKLEETGKIRNLAIQTPAQQKAGQRADNDRGDDNRYDSAKTGKTTVKDSTGKTVTRDTYDPEKVREQAKKDATSSKGRRGGRATGGLVQRRKKK